MYDTKGSYLILLDIPQLFHGCYFSLRSNGQQRNPSKYARFSKLISPGRHKFMVFTKQGLQRFSGGVVNGTHLFRELQITWSCEKMTWRWKNQKWMGTPWKSLDGWSQDPFWIIWALFQETSNGIFENCCWYRIKNRAQSAFANFLRHVLSTAWSCLETCLFLEKHDADSQAGATKYRRNHPQMSVMCESHEFAIPPDHVI